MTNLPKALSVGEETFWLHCRANGLQPEREYFFHPKRKWRFDFFFPDVRLAVEVEGGVNGRHQRIGGFTGDAFKYNAAAMMGIFVLRYTTAMVTDGTAINDVMELLRRVAADR
jgi:very-short-patch-repair endonuclease